MHVYCIVNTVYIYLLYVYIQYIYVYIFSIYIYMCVCIWTTLCDQPTEAGKIFPLWRKKFILVASFRTLLRLQWNETFRFWLFWRKEMKHPFTFFYLRLKNLRLFSAAVLFSVILVRFFFILWDMIWKGFSSLYRLIDAAFMGFFFAYLYLFFNIEISTKRL